MKNSRLFIYIIIILFSLTSCQNKVDLIVHNATVYTMGETRGIASAFVVNNGKFIDVGGEELLNRYEAKKTLDLQELAVFPGFIDSHCHFLSLGLSLQQADLVGTKSFEEVLTRIQQFSNQSKATVLMGRGWDQNDWENKKLPTKEKLDQLFPDIPVVLKRIDGHAMLVNQKALEMAGINEDTFVEGGTIIKEKGKLTGVLVDAPMRLITEVLPQPTVEEKIKALKDAEEIAFANGLTTVSVAGMDREDITLIDSLQKSGQLTIRVYAMVSNTKGNLEYYLSKGPIKTEKLNVRSFKVYADGALGSRGAALKSSYSDLEGHNGEFITSIDSLEKLAYKLSTTPFQMNAHAIGDAANHAVLNAYRKALSLVDDPRWRIEHAQIIDTVDISLFNRKIIPSVQPTHATSDMYWAEERLGKDRLYGAYANQALLERSGRIALGTDFPVEEVNPFMTFYAAVFRQDANQYPEEGYLKENKLSRTDAMRGMTIWGAYANFEENEKGSIEPGKVADFVILDRDIMKVSDKRVLKARVVATLVDGNIVYSNRIN
jgi:predicted amidohydrolase YtcJ